MTSENHTEPNAEHEINEEVRGLRMSHYETLGVEPDASPDDIKRAFRKKASEVHPDREGGSTDLMQAVNKAHEVLSDPDRRAQYDATGSDEKGPSIEEAAKQVLMQLFGSALDGDAADVLGDVRQTLKLAAGKLSEMKAQVEHKREKLVKRSGKVRRKSGDNIVKMLIDQKCNDMAQAIMQMSHGLKVNELAQAMLDEYEADPEPVFVHGAPSAAYNGNGPYAGFFGTSWPL